jgi:hypothetical protein
MFISQAGSTEHSHTANQAKLDNARLWSSFGCPGGHDLDNKAIHSTYSTKHGLIWEFLKEILTEIRISQGVAHGLPRLARL